jgi:hypothetical protein
MAKGQQCSVLADPLLQPLFLTASVLDRNPPRFEERLTR